MIELVCPECRGRLDALRCAGCGAAYREVGGVPVLVPSSSAATDLWEQAESGLSRALRDDPELERALLAGEAESLAPADAMLRAMVLDERGAPEADEEAEAAFRRLYTPESLAAADGLVGLAADEAARGPAPIVDLATGRGRLLAELRRRTDAELVAVDLSPRVLRRALRLPGVRAVAADALALPFADGSVPVATSFLGLGNVARPRELLAELRRVVSGRLLAVVSFYPEDDAANAAAIRSLGHEDALYRERLLAALAATGWRARVVASREAPALPTPAGVLLAGAVIDGLPVAPTSLEWALVEAT